MWTPPQVAPCSSPTPTAPPSNPVSTSYQLPPAPSKGTTVTALDPGTSFQKSQPFHCFSLICKSIPYINSSHFLWGFKYLPHTLKISLQSTNYFLIFMWMSFCLFTLWSQALIHHFVKNKLLLDLSNMNLHAKAWDASSNFILSYLNYIGFIRANAMWLESNFVWNRMFWHCLWIIHFMPIWNNILLYIKFLFSLFYPVTDNYVQII